MYTSKLATQTFKSVIMSAKRFNSTITPVRTTQAPPPAASYSQAIKVNGFIYVSGQIPYTAENKPLPESATIADQAEQVIQNVSNILEASNSSLKHIVKANIFLTDMPGQFGEFNKVYGKYFSEHKPARSCVAVKELPLGVALEMEVVAIEKDDTKL
ncbi:Protein MMF1, mitochondrial [Candida viswanathii]|uniref:Protein MMF1, mitochondrial n=1 Tax=Candida viswanathii TaxID=5486 RepID=A0A367XSZ7_9ASCO|nr:Protein MMF1, mitochondrial [Candida viswanathii]